MTRTLVHPSLRPALVFTTAAMAWAAILPVAAFAASFGSGIWGDVAAAVYGLGHVICHQRPERSFAWGGTAWPVCARCTGLYVGAALGACAGLGAPIVAPVPPSRVRLALALAAGPAVASLLFEWGSRQTPSNLVRAATGLFLGLTTACLLVWFLREPGASGQRPSRLR